MPLSSDRDSLRGTISVSKTTEWLLTEGAKLGLEFIGNPSFQDEVKKLQFKLCQGNFSEQVILLAQRISQVLICNESIYHDERGRKSKTRDWWIAKGQMHEEASVYSKDHGLETLFQCTYRKLVEKKQVIESPLTA